MKERKKFEEWAKKILVKYQKILLLDDRFLEFEYVEKLKRSGLFNYHFNSPYKYAYITYSDTALEYFKRKRDHAYLRQGLIHELCHCITERIYLLAVNRYTSEKEIEDAMEEATDHFANVISKSGL